MTTVPEALAPRFAGVLVCSVIAACGSLEGREVPLGAAALRAGDLSRCVGSCVAQTVPDEAINEDGALPCPMGVGQTLQIVWQHALSPGSTSPANARCGDLGPCELKSDGRRITTASDGSLWLVGMGVPIGTDFGFEPPSELAEALILTRYAPDGSLLHRHVGPSVRVELNELLEQQWTVAPDDDAGIIVGVWQSLAREGFTRREVSRWVERHGSDGQPSGAVVLSGEYRGSSGPLTVAAAHGPRYTVLNGTRIAQFQGDHRIWVVAIESEPMAIASDAMQHVTLYSESYEPDVVRSVFEHFDDGGRLLWKRTSTRLSPGGTLSADGHGDVYRSAEIAIPDRRWMPDPATPGPAPLQVVHRISQAGESRWAITVKPSLDEGVEAFFRSSQAPVIAEDGAVWVLGPAFVDAPIDTEPPEVAPSESGTIVYQIAPDASACTEHRFPGASSTLALERALDGEFYFMTDMAVGRVRLP